MSVYMLRVMFVELIKVHRAKVKISFTYIHFVALNKRAGAENLNKAISENLLPFKVREDIRMDQKNEKKSKKKSLTSI